MKKIYQTPSAEIIKIATSNIFALSFGKNAKGADEGVVLSRRRMWEDDEENY